MGTYYAFLNEFDVCYLVADPVYEPCEGFFPYKYFDYSASNTQCIKLPEEIETFSEAICRFTDKKYDRSTQTWHDVAPEAGTDDVQEYATFGNFPQKGETVATDPACDRIYIAKDTNETYRWDTKARKYQSLLAGVNVVDGLTSESATEALSANQGRILKELIDQLTEEIRQLKGESSNG